MHSPAVSSPQCYCRRVRAKLETKLGAATSIGAFGQRKSIDRSSALRVNTQIVRNIVRCALNVHMSKNAISMQAYIFTGKLGKNSRACSKNELSNEKLCANSTKPGRSVSTADESKFHINPNSWRPKDTH